MEGFEDHALSNDFVPVVSVIRVEVVRVLCAIPANGAWSRDEASGDRSSQVLHALQLLICAHLRDRDAKHRTFPRAGLSGSIRLPVPSIAWLNRHSLGANASTDLANKNAATKNLRSTCSAGEPSIEISLGLLLRKTKKALVEKRREDGDDCDDDERGDSVELIEL